MQMSLIRERESEGVRERERMREREKKEFKCEIGCVGAKPNRACVRSIPSLSLPNDKPYECLLSMTRVS